MAYDGIIKFDTKVDETGLKSGLSKLKSTIAALGITASIAAITKGLINLSKESVNLYATQEQAEAKLAQTIEATGHAAGVTTDEMINLASSLQGVTKFSDEAIIGAESLLLTFKEIGGDVMPSATEAVLNVSEAMGTDLKSSAVQIGKALNDPISGLTALSRTGIQFTDDQKKIIKSFVETGDVASAQKIILGELESQFGGVARAAADTATGGIDQLKNAWGDLKEQQGRWIVDTAEPTVTVLTEIVTALTEVKKAQNDYRESLKAWEEGTETLEDQLVVLEESLQKTREASTRWGLYGDALEETLQPIKDQIEAVKRQISIQESLNARREAASEDERRRAEEDAEREAERTRALLERQKVADAAYKSIADGFEIIADKEETAKITGEEFDATLERRKLIIKEINTLNEAGFSAESGAIQYITSLYGDYLGQYEEYQDLVQEGRDAATEWLEEYKERQEEAAEAEIEAQERTIDAYRHKLKAVQQAAEGVGEVIGEVIQGEMTLGEAAKAILLDLISSALRALGKQWGIEALAAYAMSFLNPAYLNKAIGLTAASAAAYVGAGIVKSFDVGSWDIPSDTLAMVHKNEMILPVTFAESLRQAVSSSSTQQTSSATQSAAKKVLVGNDSSSDAGNIYLDSRRVGRWINNASDRQVIRPNQRSVVGIR